MPFDPTFARRNLNPSPMIMKTRIQNIVNQIAGCVERDADLALHVLTADRRPSKTAIFGWVTRVGVQFTLTTRSPTVTRLSSTTFA